MVFFNIATFKLGVGGEAMMLKPMAHAVKLNLRIQVVYLPHSKLHYFVNKFYLIIPVSYNVIITNKCSQELSDLFPIYTASYIHCQHKLGTICISNASVKTKSDNGIN
jgi:hypothetical protein